MNIEQLKKQDKKHAQRIADYLLKRIETDLPLREKLESTAKTLKGCVDYCKEQARKHAEDGCAMITDEEVFEWCVHYFLEDSIKEGSKNSSASTNKVKDKESVTKPNKTPQSKNSTKNKKDIKENFMEQLSLFDGMEF